MDIMNLFGEISEESAGDQKVFDVQSFNYEHGRFVGFVTRRGKAESAVIAIPEGGLVSQESISNKTGEGFDRSNTKLKVLDIPRDVYMTFITVYFGMKIKSIGSLADINVHLDLKGNVVRRTLRVGRTELKVKDCSIPVAVMESKADWEFWEHTNKEEVLKYLRMMGDESASSSFGKSGKISVEEGLEVFKEHRDKIVSTELYRPLVTSKILLQGIASIETVRVANPDSDHRLEDKEVLYPSGAEDGDTSVIVLLETLYECRVDDNCLRFFYEEDGNKGSIAFFFEM